MDRTEMKNMLYHLDNNEVAEEMFRLLTDEDVKTYDMFEDLVMAYTSDDADDSFRSGMDKVLTILLWKNMQEIAETMKEYVTNEAS